MKKNYLLIILESRAQVVHMSTRPIRISTKFSLRLRKKIPLVVWWIIISNGL